MSLAIQTAAPVDNRKPFGSHLIELAEADERIVAVTNDSVSSSGLVPFRDRFPDRLINVGIAEQNLIGVSAGLASAGLIPFVCGAGPFLSGRATEQIKADIAYSQFPVILCSMSPGMAYGELGPTHHSLEDISWMRALPGLDVSAPADEVSTIAAMDAWIADPRPTYMRVGRYKVPPTSGPDHPWVRGKAAVISEGADVVFFTYGTTVSTALQAADELQMDGIEAGVVDMRFLAPIDRETIVEQASETRAVIVAEEANTSGALGAAVAMTLQEAGLNRPTSFNGPTEFAPTGTVDYLLDYFGISGGKLVSTAKGLLRDA